MLVFIVSILANGNACLNYFLHYIVFGTTAFILTSIPYDPKIVIKTTVIVYIIYLCVYLFRIKHTYLDSSDYDLAQMGLAYSFTPGVLISLSVLFHSKQLHIYYNPIFFIFTIIVFAGSLYVILFQTMTRGALISLLFGFVAILSLRVSLQKRFCIYVFILFVVFFCVILGDVLLEQIMAISKETSIAALHKMSTIASGEDFSSGRVELYSSAIEIIKNSPIFGNGIGYFEKYHGIYIHQFILQALCEFGLLGAFIFFIPILKSVKVALLSKVSAEVIILLVIVSSVLIIPSEIYTTYASFNVSSWLLMYSITSIAN